MRRLHLAPLGLAMLAVVLIGSPLRAADEDDPLVKQIKELNKVTGDDAVRPKAIELSKDKEKAQKLIDKAEDMAKLDSKQFKYNAARILGLVAGQIKDYDAAMRFFKIGMRHGRDIKSAEKIIESFEGQLRVLYAQKKYEEAQELCNEVLGLDVNEDLERMKFFVIEELVRSLTRQGKVDRALEITDKILSQGDASWYFTQVKAWVLHEAGRNEESAKTYNEAIELLEKNENLKPDQAEKFIDDIRYRLSNVYVELGQVEKSIEQLKTLLKRHPDHPSYNNDLGYIWADHDMNFEEAEKLIRKALEEDRKAREKQKDLPPEENVDNPAYLDSLGWVLYKQKKYTEAKKPLLEAVKHESGQHIEILDHLADVHMALGEKEAAIEVWKKALDLEANTRRDLKRRAEVIKKLKAAQGEAPAAKDDSKKK